MGARAFLAGAALLAGAVARPAMAGGRAPDETAFAMPRPFANPDANGLALPRPLPLAEAARVRRILALQRGGQVQAAVLETGRLTDTTLLGTLLADRYLARGARVTAPELSAWLGRYADLPDAVAIYDKLLRDDPRASRPPVPPGGSLAPETDAAAPQATPRHAPPARVLAIAARRASQARSAFAAGRDGQALLAGRDAFQRSDRTQGEGAYLAGLVEWRRGRFEAARGWFEAAAHAPLTPVPLRAAAAFWAARAHLRTGDASGWRPWMQRAAAAPDTLHGMLARQALGMRLTPAEPGDTLAEADLDAIAALPGGRRAFALLQVGEPALAEAEFRRVWPTLETVAMRRALWLTARAAGLDGLASQLGGLVSDPARGGPEAPPRLSPRGGFTLDPALVYAVARVESNFDPRAHSGAGAHGMMQVTPIAARAIAPQGRGGLPRDTAGNLQLGQRYMDYLAKDGLAGDDLLRVLASYNAGPASTAHWQTRDGGDPLLFLEAIPVDETRRFVQRTLSFAWSYAARLGLESPSLEAMAEGAWPRFAPERRPH